MSKAAKVWLMIAAVLVLTGSGLFVGVMCKLNWDFSKLSTVKYIRNSHEISQSFDRISVDTEEADVRFVLSEDGRCRVECREEEKAIHTVTVRDGTLKITVDNQKRWYDYIGIDAFCAPQITVYLPETEYISLLVWGETGDVEIFGDFFFREVEIAVDTGDLTLKDVVAEQTIMLETNTGDIRLEGCDAAELSLETDTGDISGSLLTEKIFLTEVSTGDVQVPKTTTGGVCSAKTDTGDIDITIS